MFLQESNGVRNGHLTIGGADAVELAKEYGTPLIALDEMCIRKNAQMYKNAIDCFYNGRGLVLYASKAFSCKEICRIMAEEGIGLDVVSGGELYTAMQAGFPPERICFHGSFKSREEIKMALDYGVGRFIIDNDLEVQNINELAAGKKVKCLVRITPGVDAHTHDFIRTGKIDSKFGTPIEKGAALRFIGRILKAENIELCGLHCHIGSQIFDLEPFAHTAEVMLDFMCQVRDTYGVTFDELNLGGGFGIKYVEGNNPVQYDRYMEEISKKVHAMCADRGYQLPFIYMEPGRSMVGNAGTTLYTVGAIKEIEGVRTYVTIDGGMTDNPRYALYQAEYAAAIANKMDKPADQIVTIAGRCCESGDLIQENISIQQCESGDILAVFATGAYNYSMASNYNRVPRPAVVLVREGAARLAIRRESYEDLIHNDI